MFNFNMNIYLILLLLTLLLSAGCISIENLKDIEFVTVSNNKDWQTQILHTSSVYKVQCLSYECQRKYLAISDLFKTPPKNCFWCYGKVEAEKMQIIPYSFKDNNHFQLIICPESYSTEQDYFANQWSKKDHEAETNLDIEIDREAIMELFSKGKIKVNGKKIIFLKDDTNEENVPK